MAAVWQLVAAQTALESIMALGGDGAGLMLAGYRCVNKAIRCYCRSRWLGGRQ